MPWKLSKQSGKYCVVRESDGSTVHCHETEAEALAQQRALYAGEKRASSRKCIDAPGDEDSEDGLLVFGWESAKALPADGEFVGYLWRWGSPDLPDATKFKDYFTPSTDFGRYVRGEIEGYLHHALPTMKGKANPAGDNSIGTGTIAIDAEGGWLKARLDLSVPGAGDTWDALKADDDSFGLSSGAVSHLVRRQRQPNGAHWIKKWPVVEWSITPDPGERRTAAVALKALDDPAGGDGSTKSPEGAASAPTFDEELLRLATDAERLRARSAEFAALRRDRDGRDLSHSRLDAFKAVADAFGGLHREYAGAITPAVDREEYRALLDRARQALKPARPK